MPVNSRELTVQGDVVADPDAKAGSLKLTVIGWSVGWQSAVTGTTPSWNDPDQLRSSCDAAARPRPAMPVAMRTPGTTRRRLRVVAMRSPSEVSSACDGRTSFERLRTLLTS